MKSISSIVTGLYPPKHGVYTWRDRLGHQTLFDISALSTGFYNPAAGGKGGVSGILNQTSEDTLEEIQPPFFYFERDQGGHAPYRDFTYQEMVAQIDHQAEKLQSYYDEAIAASVSRFNNRLDTLEDRGLLKNTLVVFLGDHGELLGEHGLVSHSSPPVPELVYVPVVFFHPELPSGTQPDTIGHVDIVPTILSALDMKFDSNQFDGVDLFTEEPGYRFNDSSHFHTIFGQRLNLYYAAGFWDGDGGHVFNLRGKTLSPLIGWRTAQGWNRAYWKQNPRQIVSALACYSVPHHEHGSPGLSKDEASNKVKKVRKAEATTQTIELDKDVEQRLTELGYRT
jgi:arylsulfatase A-like enzyme